jgi:hypothetical protein
MIINVATGRSEATVRRGDISSMIASALITARPTSTVASTPVPSNRLTCSTSLVARLITSPLDIALEKPAPSTCKRSTIFARSPACARSPALVTATQADVWSRAPRITTAMIAATVRSDSGPRRATTASTPISKR